MLLLEGGFTEALVSAEVMPKWEKYSECEEVTREITVHSVVDFSWSSEHGWKFRGLFNAITAYQCYSSIWVVAVATA